MCSKAVNNKLQGFFLFENNIPHKKKKKKKKKKKCLPTYPNFFLHVIGNTGIFFFGLRVDPFSEGEQNKLDIVTFVGSFSISLINRY